MMFFYVKNNKNNEKKVFVWAKIRTWDLRSIYMGWFSPYEVGIGLRKATAGLFLKDVELNSSGLLTVNFLVFGT